MTDDQANGQIGHNAGDFEKMADYVLRAENIAAELRSKKAGHAAECRPFHGDRKQLLKDAKKEMGIPGPAITATEALRDLDRKIRDTLNELDDDIRFFVDGMLNTEKLGPLAEMPLGLAAISREAKEKTEAAAQAAPPPPGAGNANLGA